MGDLERNAAMSPSYSSVDMALSRRIAVGASRSVELRLEAFNLFNRFNWGDAVTNFNAGTFGRR